jgi:hypothetical protein
MKHMNFNLCASALFIAAMYIKEIMGFTAGIN